MLMNFAQSLRNVAAVAALSCVAFMGGSAYAGALTGDLTLDGNTAVTFDPSTTTPLTVRFSDPNLNGAQHLQLGARTTNGVTFALASLTYSFDNLTYWTFETGSLTTGVAPAYMYTATMNIPSVSQDIYFQYTLPSGLDNLSITQVALYANNDGAVDGSGVLLDDITNGYVNLVRTHTAVGAPPVPEPATMTIALVGMGLAGAARLRKRFSKKA